MHEHLFHTYSVHHFGCVYHGTSKHDILDLVVFRSPLFGVNVWRRNSYMWKQVLISRFFIMKASVQASPVGGSSFLNFFTNSFILNSVITSNCLFWRNITSLFSHVSMVHMGKMYFSNEVGPIVGSFPPSFLSKIFSYLEKSLVGVTISSLTKVLASIFWGFS